MSVTYSLWLQITMRIVGAILDAVTPHIRELIADQIKVAYEKAKETDNPWDDFLVKLLADILRVKV